MLQKIKILNPKHKANSIQKPCRTPARIPRQICPPPTQSPRQNSSPDLPAMQNSHQNLPPDLPAFNCVSLHGPGVLSAVLLSYFKCDPAWQTNTWKWMALKSLELPDQRKQYTLHCRKLYSTYKILPSNVCFSVRTKVGFSNDLDIRASCCTYSTTIQVRTFGKFVRINDWVPVSAS